MKPSARLSSIEAAFDTVRDGIHAATKTLRDSREEKERDATTAIGDPEPKREDAVSFRSPQR